MLLENALSEEIETPRVAEVTQRDYTAEKDKTIAACSGAILTSLTSTYTLLGLLIPLEEDGGRKIFGGKPDQVISATGELAEGRESYHRLLSRVWDKY